MMIAVSLWLRWWILFPATNLVGMVLLFVAGLDAWNPWLQILALVALGVSSTRIVPEIMWDGDRKPPLRRGRRPTPAGRC